MTTYGRGTIEPRGGKFRVRVYVDGKAKTLGTYPTEAEAIGVRDGWLKLRAEGEVEIGGQTFATYGEAWLDRVEAEGMRSIDDARSRWKRHVSKAPFASWPLDTIKRTDVRAWVTKLRTTKRARRGKGFIGWQTVKHCVNLARSVFKAALADEILDRNPCDGISIVAPDDADEVWTYLLADEQERLLDAIPVPERYMVGVALHTGMRQGEQWNLELRDVHLDDPAGPWLYVRFGSPGKKPKNGEERRVELSPIAAADLKAWIDALPRYARGAKGVHRNPHGLAFPTERGCRRQEGKAPRGWPAWLKTAGLEARARHDRRPVRWHDLRHTCASSLIAGWWGRVWTMMETKAALGHKSLESTERYAHLAPSVVAAAAAATTTRATANRPKTVPGPAAAAAQSGGIIGRVTLDSNQRPSAPEDCAKSCSSAAVGPLGDDSGTIRAQAERVLRAVAGRDRFATRYAVELAEAVLRATEVVAAPVGRRSGGAS